MRPLLLTLLITILLSCNNKAGKNAETPTTVKEPEAPLTTSLNRPTYSLKYLSSWIIDSSSEEFDLDRHFTLHSPVESGVITFFIFNTPKDEAESLQNQINAHLAETMKDGTVTYFSKWGNYQGHGAIITGKMSGVWPGEIKIFIHSTATSSFLVTSIYADSYKNDVLPGLNHIESSFVLK
ncbi:MAG: hypothetical protein ABIT05_08715 [Chitinophagaceae bacterium]